MSDLIKKLLVLFDDVSIAIHKHVCSSTEQETDKLTMSQIKVLQFVTRVDRVSMADIAKHLNITPASATSLVDKLVQLGWLQREVGDKDRRKVWVVLGDEKKADWEKQHTNQMERLSEFLGVLNNEQQKELISILEDLVNQEKK